VALTTADVTEIALQDLLEAEKRLRELAEAENRELRAALQLAAYTFAGEEYEKELRRDQRILDRWAPGDWMAFLQRVAPVGRGWSDPAVLSERLRQVVAERDALAAEVLRLREELALRAQLSPGIATAGEPKPENGEAQEEKQERQRKQASFQAPPGFRWPQVPKRPPKAYARHFRPDKWDREGLILALIACGLCLRVEVAELVGWRFGVSGRAGSVKRLFTGTRNSLDARGLIRIEVVQLGLMGVMIVGLTDLGRKIVKACGWEMVETEYERLKRLHGGDGQVKHATAVCAFAYQARRRGYRVQVVPEVEGPAEPDALIVRDEERIYVEVELGRDKPEKWHNMVNLQGFVALCAANEEARKALATEVKRLRLPGRATDLGALIGEKDEGRLWVEEWK